MLVQCNKLHADCSRYAKSCSNKRMLNEKPSDVIVYAETDQDEGVMYWQTDTEEEHEESLTAAASAAMVPTAQSEQTAETKRSRRHSSETSDGTHSDGSNSSN